MVIIAAHNAMLIKLVYLGAEFKKEQKEIYFHLNSLPQDVLKSQNINKYPQQENRHAQESSA